MYYENLSWVWGADRKSVRGSLLASRSCAEWFQTVIPRDGFVYPNNHDRFFFFHMHTFRSPEFDFSVRVAMNESCCFNTLTSAILKVNVVRQLQCLISDRVTWPPIQWPMYWQHVLLFVFYPSHVAVMCMENQICQHWRKSWKTLSGMQEICTKYRAHNWPV